MMRDYINKVNFYNKALDGTWERHKAISGNIANVNTPNYKRKYVTFEDQLAEAVGRSDGLKLTRTDKNHIPKGDKTFNPITHEDVYDFYRFDGNNVNIDTESANLAKNTIMYDAITRQVSNEFEKIKNVITEGSK